MAMDDLFLSSPFLKGISTMHIGKLPKLSNYLNSFNFDTLALDPKIEEIKAAVF